MTGPSYTVKNIEAIAEGSDMRARLYTLAPGDVIPWHYHTAVTDWYFCLVGILRVETRAPRGDERLDRRAVAEQKEFALGMTRQRQFRAGDNHGRAMVSPHRVESNADLLRHSMTLRRQVRKTGRCDRWRE